MTDYEFDNRKEKTAIDIPLPDLELALPIETYRKIMAYAEAAGDTEITGFADVEYFPEDGLFLADEVYLIEQKASGAHVDMDEEAMAKFNLEMVKKGITQLPRIWWHSHVDMQAFFSQTDEDTSVQLQNETYNISLVVNKRHEMRAKIYIATIGEVSVLGEKFPLKEWLCIDPLPVKVLMEWTRIPKEIVDEVKKKVRDNVSPWGNLFRKKNDDREEEDDSEQHDEKVHLLDSGHKKKGKKNNSLRRGDTDADYQKFHDSYTTDQRVKVYRLPNNEKEAKRKIIELGLKESYNEKSDNWVWKNKDESEIYVDFWKVLPSDFDPRPYD